MDAFTAVSRGTKAAVKMAGPVGAPLAVQSIGMFLISRTPSLRVSSALDAIWLGLFTASVFAGAFGFRDYLAQPLLVKLLYPPIMLLILVFFSAVFAGLFGISTDF